VKPLICATCDRPMRSKHQTLEDVPGSVCRSSAIQCQPCRQLERRLNLNPVRVLLDVVDLPGAVCAQTDPEVFFPEKGGATAAAKAVCAGCPVRVECLEGALERGERHGIWGGLSEYERRPMRAAAKAVA